ncbi:MAG: FHA domain-containing protein [Pseudomonadota bacterium]
MGASASGGKLVIRFQDQEAELCRDAEERIRIGSAPDNELSIDGEFVSRFHAEIRWGRTGFELIDHSTNGAFVQLEDERVRYLHRSSFRLWGSGFVSLGEPPRAANALVFRNQQSSRQE